jgi:hypothetical protein
MRSNRAGLFLFILFILSLLLGSCLLYWEVPVGNRDGGWGHVALRNWREFGFFKLHGQLACNVAGAGLPEHPEVYPGHQPASLYLHALVGWLTGCKDGLASHLVFSLIVGFGIWRLLGGGVVAVAAALLSVFSPGYLRFVTLLDPVGIPILLAIPLLAWIRNVLGRDRISPASTLAITVALAVYASLNWSAVCGFAMVTVYLLAALPGRFKRLLLFMAGCGVAGGLVLAVSVLSKKAPSAASAGASAGFAGLLNNYLFGSGGYSGYPMNWSRAILRLGTVEVVSLLPLWILFLAVAWRSLPRSAGADRARWFRAFGPLLVAQAFIFGMRNYFAAQPWMVGPVIITGLAFSLRLLRDCAGTQSIRPDAAALSIPDGLLASSATPCGGRSSWLRLSFGIAAAFLYGLLILCFFRVSSSAEDSLLQVLRTHTARHDRIFVVPEADPDLAKTAPRIADFSDRLVLPVPPGEAPSQAAGTRIFQLTAKPLPGDTWLARTDSSTSTPVAIMKNLVRWYQVHIVKRQSGDQMQLDPTLYLYHLP